jgi:peptidoglycan/xylan/chitin deacetylase (PgdA/CDA1 family)
VTHPLSAVLYGTLVRVGVDRILRHRNRHRIAILAYHGLHGGECDALENFDGLLTHVDRFARQMRFLRRHYHVVPLEECLASDGPPHRVVITFDDGYASLYTHAFPILKALRLPATVFVPTDFVTGGEVMWWDRLRCAVKRVTAPVLTVSVNGTSRTFGMASLWDRLRTMRALHDLLKPLAAEERRRIIERLGLPQTADPLRAPLTVRQMRDMAAHGMTFQSHGATHRSFETLSAEEVSRELTQSKRILEAWVGQEVSWLAYPFGDTGPDVENALERNGYHGAVTMREGLGCPDERLRLPRLAIGDPMSPGQFAAAVSGLRLVMAAPHRRLVGRG